MEQSITVKRGLLLGTAALLMALLSASTPERTYADGGNASLVHACVDRWTQVRIVGSNDACDPGERSLHWVMTGPQGPAGLGPARAPGGLVGPPTPAAPDCGPGWIACGGKCFKPEGFRADRQNCGRCGRVCSPGWSCADGQCLVPDERPMR